MKKLFSSKIFLSFCAVAIVILTLLGFIFSPFGNYFLAKALLATLQTHTQMQWKSNSFKLTPSHFSLEFSAKDGNLELFAQGEYSLFLRTLKGEFFAHSKGFATHFNQHTLYFKENQWIEGKFAGDFDNYILQASSNLIDSQSDIMAYFHYLNLQHLKLDLKNGSLAYLLEMLEEKQYGDGIINLTTNLSKNEEKFDGTLNINIEGGELNQEAFLSDFNLRIPQTNFMGELQSSIAQNTFTHQLKIYSTLGDITLNGTTNIQSLATNTDFNIELANLSPLSPFFKLPLNGAFSAKGIAKGDFKNMLLDGEIQLSNSPLNYNLNLQNLKPKTLKISSKNLKAHSLFLLFNKNPYFEGNIDLNMDLRDFSHGISGIITLKSQNLFINSPLLEEKTQIGFPSTHFIFDSKIELANGSGLLDYTLQSNLILLKTQQGHFTLHPFDFNFPTEFEVSKLQNLSFQNKTTLQGSLKSSGNYTKDSFDLKGNIIYENSENPFSLLLTPQNFILRINQIPSSQIYTLFDKIPHYFNGIGNFSLNNDFNLQISNINFDIHKLTFQDSPLLREFQSKTQQNIAKENFSGYIYNTILQDKTIQSRIQLQSNALKIQSQKIVTNLNNKKLNGDFTLTNRKGENKYTISGNISSPLIHSTK